MLSVPNQSINQNQVQRRNISLNGVYIVQAGNGCCWTTGRIKFALFGVQSGIQVAVSLLLDIWEVVEILQTWEDNLVVSHWEWQLSESGNNKQQGVGSISTNSNAETNSKYVCIMGNIIKKHNSKSAFKIWVGDKI